VKIFEVKSSNLYLYLQITYVLHNFKNKNNLTHEKLLSEEIHCFFLSSRAELGTTLSGEIRTYISIRVRGLGRY